MIRDILPVHPGEILEEKFLDPHGVSVYRLAKATRVPQDRVSTIVHGRRGVTADTVLRFGRFFGVEPQFWLNLQVRYDLEVAREALGEQLAVTPFRAA